MLDAAAAVETAKAASMAKAQLSDFNSRTTNRAVQIHGGIGFPSEHDMHLWFKTRQVERLARLAKF